MTFTKLFTSITESTIWGEPDHVRLLWITLLAMADRRGRVFGSVPGIANRARITVEQTEDGLQRFQQPDKYSRTKDFGGRRIAPLDGGGGFLLLNHKKYRDMRDEEAVKESKRKYINNRRALEKQAKALGVTLVDSSVEKVERGRLNADSDAAPEAEADGERKNSQASDIFTSDEWKVYESFVLDYPDKKKLPRFKGFYRCQIEKHGLEAANEMLEKSIDTGNPHLLDPDKF